jgi:hypothetical protein
MTSCLTKTVVHVHSWMQVFRNAGVRPIRRARIAAIVACCMVALFARPQGRVSESSVKAAYLFNFGKFVRFTPPEAAKDRQNFNICIVGSDPFGRTLDELTANERLDDKPVRIVRLKSTVEARDCAIAFISASEGGRVGSDLEFFRGQKVLTVSDSRDFLQHGGMIQFVTVDNHVRFAVNLDATRDAQLSLSSELLRVAISVNGDSSQGERP